MGSRRADVEVDAVIIGAGVCGLWLANVLAQRGLAVVICDPKPVGGTQTLASQGIVHGGLKYALNGRPSRASQALATMPARWRRCLSGAGEVDLRGVQVLADNVHLFCPVPGAKVRTLVASRFLAGGVRRIDAAGAAPFHRGLLLELDDFVLDVPSLVRRLAERVAGQLVKAAPTLIAGPSGIAFIDAGSLRIRAATYLLTAGAGNEALARVAGFADVAMLRRPLRQTCVLLREPARLFAHCLARAYGVEPDLTVTSHGRALYVGGRIAGDGAARSPQQQTAAVRDLLARFFPAIDLAGARWRTSLAVRAEPAANGLPATGDAFVLRRGNCVLCWPIKLSLMPRVGDRVLSLLDDLVPVASAWQGQSPAAVEYGVTPYAFAEADEVCGPC